MHINTRIHTARDSGVKSNLIDLPKNRSCGGKTKTIHELLEAINLVGLRVRIDAEVAVPLKLKLVVDFCRLH